MKKRVLLLVGTVALIALMVGIAVANERIGLKVNGREISPDVAPQIVDGRVLVPVRWIAEALGTEVEWDQGTRTVNVSSFSGDRRVELLESALAPASPEAAAETWANGVKNRNGALQYAVMSPALRNTMREDFEGMNWVTGTSSPWVESYFITDKGDSGNGGRIFDVSFKLATSTGDAGVSNAVITVVPENPGGTVSPAKWLVNSIQRETQITELKLSLPMTGDWSVFKESGAYTIKDSSGQVIGGIEQMGGLYAPNHSLVVEEKNFKGPRGEGRILVLDRSVPAAETGSGGKVQEWREVHGFIPWGDRNWLDLWVKVSPENTVEVLKEDIQRSLEGARVLQN